MTTPAGTPTTSATRTGTTPSSALGNARWDTQLGLDNARWDTDHKRDEDRDDTQLALGNARWDTDHKRDEDRDDTQLALDNARWDAERKRDEDREDTAEALKHRREDAALAVEWTLFEAVHAGYITVAQSSLDRSVQRGTYVVTAAGSIVTLYTGLLALRFSASKGSIRAMLETCGSAGKGCTFPVTV